MFYSSRTSKHLNDYNDRGYEFFYDTNYIVNSYKAAAYTCRNHLVSNFKTNFTVSQKADGSFKVVKPEITDFSPYSYDSYLFDEQVNNIR